MSIFFTGNINSFRLHNKHKLERWITMVIEQEGKRVGKLSYFFCDDEYLLDVNRRFLNHDTYTDIITFDYTEGDHVSGDIMISVDRVKDNALQFGVSFEQELHRVIIHGVLHLLGQGDKGEEESRQMRSRENASLEIYDSLQ